jgi:hypothetical protein
VTAIKVAVMVAMGRSGALASTILPSATVRVRPGLTTRPVPSNRSPSAGRSRLSLYSTVRTAWPAGIRLRAAHPHAESSTVPSAPAWIRPCTDEAFETAFALLMIPLIILSIKKPEVKIDGPTWSRLTTVVVFFCIGIYGGAIQAGVGLVLLAALTRAGFDLVTANNIKVLVTFAVTAVALPVFIIQGQVDWIPAFTLAVGFTAGGWVGAHVAVGGGEKLIRVVMIGATVVLAGGLLGLY